MKKHPMLQPSATCCHNLRPDDNGNVVAVRPPKIIMPGNWSPLTVDTAAGMLIVADGADLGWVYADGRSTSVELICTLPSPPVCAVVTGNLLTVMSSRGPYELWRDDAASRWVAGGVRPGGFGSVSFEAQSCGAFEAQAGGCPVEQLGASITAAYAEIAAQAAAAGAQIQPLLARCRWLDGAGKVLHATQPVMVTGVDGPQLTDFLNFASADNGVTASEKTLQANGWLLHVAWPDTPPEPWGARAVEMQVQVSPQFHPTDGGKIATVSSLRRADSDSEYLRVRLPGSARGLSANRRYASARLLTAALERFDRLAVTVATVARPFGANTPRSLTVKVPQAGTVVEHADELAHALAKPVDAAHELALRRLLPPHSFTAMGVAKSGCAPGMVAWHGLRPKRYGGDGLTAFALRTEARRCTGAVRVRFVDGSCRVARFSHSVSPVTLSPMLSYPSAEAVEMTVEATVDGETAPRTLTVPLEPDASGLNAVYVHPSLAPLAFGNDGSAAIDDGDADDAALTADADLVAVAASSSPVQIMAGCRLEAPVTAVSGARAGISAWDFGRQRMYAMTAGGIYLLASDGWPVKSLTATMLSNEVVKSGKCAALGGDCVYALTSEDRILRLCGHRVEVLATQVPGDRLTCIDDAIVTADTDDNEARHYLPAETMCWYTTDLVPRDGWVSADGRAFAETPDGIADLGREDETADTTIRWQRIFDLKSQRLPSAAFWPLKATGFDGRLSAERRWLTATHPAPGLVARMTVRGDVRSPLALPLHGHPARQMQLTAEGTIAAGGQFVLAKPELID